MRYLLIWIKVECCAVIKFLVLLYFNPEGNPSQVDKSLQDFAPSASTVQMWKAKFKRDRPCSDSKMNFMKVDRKRNRNRKLSARWVLPSLSVDIANFHKNIWTDSIGINQTNICRRRWDFGRPLRARNKTYFEAGVGGTRSTNKSKVDGVSRKDHGQNFWDAKSDYLKKVNNLIT